MIDPPALPSTLLADLAEQPGRCICRRIEASRRKDRATRYRKEEEKT